MFKTKAKRGLYKTGWTMSNVSQGDLFCTVEEIERTGTSSHIKYIEITANKNTGYGMKDWLKFLPDWVETDKVDWVGDRPKTVSGEYVADTSDVVSDAAGFIFWNKDNEGGTSLATVIERLVMPHDQRGGEWTQLELEAALREMLSDES